MKNALKWVRFCVLMEWKKCQTPKTGPIGPVFGVGKGNVMSVKDMPVCVLIRGKWVEGIS